MAATLGMLVQENYRFDGYLAPSRGLEFSDVPNGLDALDVVPLEGWVQMAVVIGMHEVLVKARPGKAPGNFGTGYFGVALDDQSSKQLRLLNVEVQNGRLAMLGILGMVRASKFVRVCVNVLVYMCLCVLGLAAHVRLQSFSCRPCAAGRVSRKFSLVPPRVGLLFPLPAGVFVFVRSSLRRTSTVSRCLRRTSLVKSVTLCSGM